MNEFRAIAIAEGQVEPLDEAERIEAWQAVVDSGLADQIKGKVLEKARKMIENGILAPGNYRGLFDGEVNGNKN